MWVGPFGTFKNDNKQLMSHLLAKHPYPSWSLFIWTHSEASTQADQREGQSHQFHVVTGRDILVILSPSLAVFVSVLEPLAHWPGYAPPSVLKSRLFWAPLDQRRTTQSFPIMSPSPPKTSTSGSSSENSPNLLASHWSLHRIGWPELTFVLQPHLPVIVVGRCTEAHKQCLGNIRLVGFNGYAKTRFQGIWGLIF